MTNTIELLEAIGKNASLRHASGQDLTQVLNGMHATTGLKMAATSGDSEHIAQELGSKVNEVNNNPHNGGCDGDGNDMESEPDQDNESENAPSDGDVK